MLYKSGQDKKDRLNSEVDILHNGEITIEVMARRLKVDRATIERDLVTLGDAGVPIYEGKRGTLGLAEWAQKKPKK